MTLLILLVFVVFVCGECNQTYADACDSARSECEGYEHTGVCNCKAIAIKCLSQPAGAGCDRSGLMDDCSNVGFCLPQQCNGTATRPVVQSCNETVYTDCLTSYATCASSAGLSDVNPCSCFPKFLACYNAAKCDATPTNAFHPTALCLAESDCKDAEDVGKHFCTSPTYVEPGQKNATCTAKAFVDCINATYLLNEKYLNYGKDNTNDFFEHLRFVAAFSAYSCNLFAAGYKCYRDNGCPSFATQQMDACLSSGQCYPTAQCKNGMTLDAPPTPTEDGIVCTQFDLQKCVADTKSCASSTGDAQCDCRRKGVECLYTVGCNEGYVSAFNLLCMFGNFSNGDSKQSCSMSQCAVSAALTSRTARTTADTDATPVDGTPGRTDMNGGGTTASNGGVVGGTTGKRSSAFAKELSTIAVALSMLVLLLLSAA